MEELFKSLSESVSKECFEDILDMVEDLLSEDVVSAIKKYAPDDKQQSLIDKANTNKEEEYAGRVERASGINPLRDIKNNIIPRSCDKNPEAYMDATAQEASKLRTKNSSGEGKTAVHRRKARQRTFPNSEAPSDPNFRKHISTIVKKSGIEAAKKAAQQYDSNFARKMNLRAGALKPRPLKFLEPRTETEGARPKRRRKSI